MRTALFVGDFDGPALDEVFHDLCCALGLIRREVSSRFELALWIAREHPANGQRLGPGGILERCAGRDFELALGPAIPFHDDGFPRRLRVAQHRTQIRKPFPDNAWPSLLMALRWGRWRKEPCIQAQRSNQAHTLLDTRQAKVNDTIGTIPNHFNRDLRQPAAHYSHHLLSQLSDGLVPLAQCFTYCWGGCQDAKKGQRPPQLCPGENHDQSHANPSQSTVADRTLLAGKQTISVMPAFADFASPAAFQGFINHDLYCPSCLHKRPHQDSQQSSTHF